MWREGAQTHTIRVGEDADMEEGWTTNVEGTCRLEAHETEALGLAGLFFCPIHTLFSAFCSTRI